MEERELECDDDLPRLRERLRERLPRVLRSHTYVYILVLVKLAITFINNYFLINMGVLKLIMTLKNKWSKQESPKL